MTIMQKREQILKTVRSVEPRGGTVDRKDEVEMFLGRHRETRTFSVSLNGRHAIVVLIDNYPQSLGTRRSISSFAILGTKIVRSGWQSQFLQFFA